ANSRETRKFMSNSRVGPVLILNGVDKEFFSVKDKFIPEDIKNIPNPIVGYAGKIGKRINVDIMEFVARKLPELSFVFIGPLLDKKWVKKLIKYKNIFFLGDKNYRELPYYLNSFDICMIPHNAGALENEGDPIKLYEYLAARKPVVTTNIAGVDLFRDYIKICKDGEEFLEGITYYIEKIKSDTGLSDRLKDVIKKEYTWAEKTKIILNEIFHAVEKVEK
ncbi:MAG: glycosyltransferase, partial [Actinomycetota bacterium]|nr:glycosyltransferase [Actinomycetota bacterium]